MNLFHSFTRVESSGSNGQSRRVGREPGIRLSDVPGAHVVGLFPGLGSRAHYQNLGRFLLDSGIPEVREIYRDGARALGFPGRVEKVLLVPENVPAGRTAQQGFIGAAFLVHSLALAAYLRAEAERRGVPMTFSAYTGESFGIITSAVTSGAVSVSGGVTIARAFTPLMMLAADGAPADDPFARQLLSYLPDHARGRELVPEPSHVVGLRGEPEDIAEALDDIEKRYPALDVEVHKLYSRRQTNVYVRSGARPDFDVFMKRFPAVAAADLKPPTTFLAHSGRMRIVRDALDRFMDDSGIEFHDPHTPVISNNDAGLLTTAAQVRRGILAITNEVMASRSTVETLTGLGPDLILELGLGNKSVQLLADNDVEVPALAYTGAVGDTDQLLGTLRLVDGLLGELERLGTHGGRLTDRHYDLLRDVFRHTATSTACVNYVHRTVSRVVADEMLWSTRDKPRAFYDFLAVVQHSCQHRSRIDVDRGELVLRARSKKSLVGPADGLGQAYTELKVIDGTGSSTTRIAVDDTPPDVVVIHFDRAEPAGRTVLNQIRHKYTMFQQLRRRRPAIFAQNDYYLEGGDPTGWLVALAASGAATMTRVLELHSALRHAGGVRAAAALDRFAAALTMAEIPVVAPEGVPLQSKKDLAAATRAIFQDGALDGRVRRIHLNGDCALISLGTALSPGQVDAGPYRTDVISVLSAADIRRGNSTLDDFEDRAVLCLTDENERVLRHAQGRRLLRSTIHAYVDIGERIVGFGKGGSESMTLFLEQDGTDGLVVRKILSEALTTAHWNPAGEGVMLPPFAKAKKQAEYLQALPESVRPYFPEVYDVHERDIPVPAHVRQEGTSRYREVIYEMSYVPGEEVSRFVERCSPPPVVVARLYEQIFRLLNETVHSGNRVPAPGETLDISYFKKIEDRLALCRSTAPHTFGPNLLDTERIVIDGVSYLNSRALLERFRERPEFGAVLEPRFHALVMGDTNTENIKIADVGPLHHAQRLVEAGAPRVEIDAALAAITPQSLGLKFLDPRAIGFGGDGRDTRDDPMYDNKPWHNSIGHYDEIHYEQFSLRVRTGDGQTPAVDIAFVEGNPYQRAYRVRDVAASGGNVDSVNPRGMEDYFGPVMTAVYDLDNPESRYLADDPYWLVRFVFMMGTHFTAMPPFHFQAELDGTLTDTYQTQRRPVAIYCAGIKWLNWALEMLEGRRTQFLGIAAPPLPYPTKAFTRNRDRTAA